MTTIDYEVEYNNRARVPDHADHIAGWARDAQAFRENTPPTPIPYGPGERETLDLFTPAAPRGEATLVFIHGGYWQALDKSFFSHLARGANAHGDQPCHSELRSVSTGEHLTDHRADPCSLPDPGKTRTPPRGQRTFCRGGIWPPACWRRIGRRALSRRGVIWSRRVMPYPGLFDLTPLMGTSINTALGLDSVSARAASPLFTPTTAPRPPLSNAVVGGDESAEYHRQRPDHRGALGRGGVWQRTSRAFPDVIISMSSHRLPTPKISHDPPPRRPCRRLNAVRVSATAALPGCAKTARS